MTAAAGDFEAARRRELGRLFALSCVAHAGLFGLLAASWPARHGDLPAVISVDLVGAVPRVAPAPAPARPAPPAPAPAAQPKPPPPPPPPKPAKVVLPKDPVKQPARKEKAPEKARPEARPEPRPKPEPPPEDLEDVLAELRAEAGEKRPEAEPEPLAAAEPGPPGPSGGALVSPEVAAWVRLAKLHVRRAWIVPPGFRTQSLVATLEVELDAGGRVVGEPDVVRPSGNPWYDEGVVRALQKASPLPPPPEAGRWSFAFDSSEAL